HAVTLNDLLAANQPLFTTYLLKEQLKALWYAPSPHTAKRRWNQWFRMAMDGCLAPVIAFARILRNYVHGIISCVGHRLTTSVREGMTNRSKVIKRMAYGYRDSNYFFLKIRAAFPGKT